LFISDNKQYRRGTRLEGSAKINTDANDYNNDTSYNFSCEKVSFLFCFGY